MSCGAVGQARFCEFPAATRQWSRRRPVRMTRRKLLYSFFGAPALIYPCFLEPRWLDLTHRQVELSRRPDRPVRILHISDLHASLVVPLSMIDHAVTMGLAQKPEL